MSNSSYVRRLVASTVAPTLKAEGWERYGRIEFRLRNSVADEAIINFQPASFGPSESAKFFVNLTITLRSLWESYLDDTNESYSSDSRPHYWDVGHVLQQRLEPFRSPGPGSWHGVWHTTEDAKPNDSELQTVGNAVLNRLRSDGWLSTLPRLLDRCTLLEVVLNHPRSIEGLDGGKTSPAALALLADDGPDDLFYESLTAAEGIVAEFPAMGRVVKWARRRHETRIAGS